MGKWMDGRRLRTALLVLVCLLAAMVAITLATGCGNSGNTDSGSSASTVRRVVKAEPVKQDRWTYARARFNEMCAGCHSLADAGARGRRYNLDASSPSAVNETHVRATITGGEPGMPAWGEVLSEREYEELVKYIVAVARHAGGDEYWRRQLTLRGEAQNWSRADTEKLEAYARRLRDVRIRAREERASRGG